MCDGVRRSDSIEFCVREILEVGFSKGGKLRAAVVRAGWHLRFPAETRWGRGYTESAEEEAYAQWVSGEVVARRRGGSAWWAWVAACGDWEQVCRVACALGWGELEFHTSRLSCLEHCRLLLVETPQARVLNSWISAHIGWPHVRPMLCTIMDGGAAPDPTSELLMVEIKPPRCSALGHLLRKAFPKRCQIRELLRFVSQYWHEDIEIEWYIRCATFCSLGGFYRHHNMAGVPNIESRRALYSLCFGSGPGSLESWMSLDSKTGELHDIQCTLLLVLQDNAISTMGALPSHTFTSCDAIGWSAFIELVSSAIATAHANFDKHRVLHCGKGGARGDNRRIIIGFGNMFFCPNDEDELHCWIKNHTAAGNTHTDWRRSVEQCGVLSTAGARIYPDRGYSGWGERSRMWHFLTRVSVATGIKYPHVEGWLKRGFGNAQHRHDALRPIARAHPEEFAQFCVMLVAFRARQEIIWYTLPKRIMEQQHRAIVNRFSSCPILPSYAGSVALCLYCGSVKNPAAMCFKGRARTPAEGRTRGYKAPGNGAGAIVFDDDDSCLRCNAATRPNPVGKENGSDKKITTALCRSSRILHIGLIGRLVNFRGSCYLLCTVCGCLVNLTRLEEGGNYTVCEFCSLPRPRICEICGRPCPRPYGSPPENWSGRDYIVYGGRGAGELSRGKICASCTRSLDTKRRRRFKGTDIVCV